MPSLQAENSPLANSQTQLSTLNSSSERLSALPRFSSKLKEINLYPLVPTKIEIFQINVGKMCNQICRHCHVDAGPDRKEIMTRETMELCLEIIPKVGASTVDLTGGAPEMNPNFRWFVEELSKLGCKILDRCNLTIIEANRSYQDLPQFFAKHNVQIISSLPFYSKRFTDRQRGDGVFESSIRALQKLNEVGYGDPKSNLQLDLVYNPVGAFLPGSQEQMESDFKRELWTHFEIKFNQLYAITNMPISRFLEYLVESNNLEGYMEKLVQSFNPAAAHGVMCRNTLSVSWDGYLYDCDFNQMLDIPIQTQQRSSHLKDVDWENLAKREINIDQHCFGCTAGIGSSCGGSLSE